MAIFGNCFHLAIQVWSFSKTRYQKTGISTAWCLLCYATAAGDRKHSIVTAFLQACEIDKRHRAYILFDIYDLKFLREAAWLCRTRAATVQMNAFSLSVRSKLDVILAILDSCVVVEYFAAHKERGKGKVSDMLGAGRVCRCVLIPQRVLQKAPGAICAPFGILGRGVYVPIQLEYRGTSNEF